MLHRDAIKLPDASPACSLRSNPQAIRAVVWYPGPQLLIHLLDWLALGVWAGKRLAFPSDTNELQARTKIRSLFLPGPGWAGQYGQLVLCVGLHDPRTPVRAKAVQVLGLFGEPAVAGELERSLHDPERSVRLQAAKALRRIHLRQTAPALLEALNAHDETLAREIHLALLQLGRSPSDTAEGRPTSRSLGALARVPRLRGAARCARGASAGRRSGG